MTSGRADRSESYSARRVDVHLLLALLLSLVAALPLMVGPGIVNTRAGGDSPFLVQRVHQLTQSLRSGTLPARWMPDAAFGLGYPVFNFYAAFPYYIAAWINIFGAGVIWGIKITQIAGFCLAGVGAYSLARAFGSSPWAALVCSATYTFAPFHLTNVYVRGDALSEFYAMAIYPWVILAVLRLRRRVSPSPIVFLALCYAALVLSHNISAMVFSPLLGLWLLVECLALPKPRRWHTLGAGALAIGLGLVLSAWFWAPALRERTLIQLQEQTTGYFHYPGHFRGFDLVQWRPVHSYAIDSTSDPFSMGLVQLFLGIGGLAAFVFRLASGPRRRRMLPLIRSQLLVVLALVAYTWLMTPPSRWLWDGLPLLAYTQFPWRLLSVQALAMALLALQIPDLLGGSGVRLLSLVLTAVVAVGGMAGLSVDRLPLREKEITPQRQMLYETYSGNIGTTIRHEYLPREMVPRPYTSAVQLNSGTKPEPLALEGRLTSAQLVDRTLHEERWEIVVAERALLAFHTSFFPGWEATVDGRPQGVEPLQGLGLIGLRLEPGAHRVRLRFEHTPTRRYATWASLVGLMVMVAVALYPALESRRYRRRALVAVGALLLAALPLAVKSPEASSDTDSLTHSRGPLVMDFARAPYLHAEPEGIFYGQAHLLDYALSGTRVQTGDELALSMEWVKAQPELEVVVSLVSATAHLFNPAPIWQEARAPIDSEVTVLVLQLPSEMPPGLYVLRLNVFSGDEQQVARSANGRGMDRVALQPVQVVGERRATGQEAVLARYGPEHALPVISLVEGGIRAVRGRDVGIGLTWRSERQAALNYWLSVRLGGPDGVPIVARDLPPFVGGYPTSLWRQGELLTDRVILTLPQDQDLPNEATLEVVLYDRRTLKAIGAATVAGVDLSGSDPEG